MNLIGKGDQISIYTILTEQHGLLTYDAQNTIMQPQELISNNRAEIDSILLEKGALLLRNFKISAMSEFKNFLETFSRDIHEYTYRSTPRRLLGGKIYSATEYPQDRFIPLHNENSYSNSWPPKIIFFAFSLPLLKGGKRQSQIVDES